MMINTYLNITKYKLKKEQIPHTFTNYNNIINNQNTHVSRRRCRRRHSKPLHLHLPTHKKTLTLIINRNVFRATLIHQFHTQKLSSHKIHSNTTNHSLISGLARCSNTYTHNFCINKDENPKKHMTISMYTHIFSQIILTKRSQNTNTNKQGHTPQSYDKTNKPKHVSLTHKVHLLYILYT